MDRIQERDRRFTDTESRLRGLLPGADCRSTAAVLRALGCDVPDLPADGAEIVVAGRGIASWTAPAALAMQRRGIFDAPVICSIHGQDANVTGRQHPGWLAAISHQVAAMTVGSSFSLPASIVPAPYCFA